MKFYVSLQGKDTPGLGYFVIVNAPCHETCVAKLESHGFHNWSTIYRNQRIVLRSNLKLWEEI